MGYAIITLWHDRQRYLPGVFAVTFSAVLIALQTGLLMGLLSVTSMPIDRTRADLWVGSQEVLSVDLGRGIPSRFYSRVANHDEIARIEPYFQGFAPWTKPDKASELCMVVGSALEDDALGSVDVLTPEMRRKLMLPNTIIVDRSELDRLGLKKGGIGEHADILNTRVTVVDLVSGCKSLAGPYVFCSQATARPLLRLQGDQTVYYLAKTKEPGQAPAVVADLKQYNDMSAFTAIDFSRRSRIHWLTKTQGGVVIGFSSLLGLLVGAVVTSQTLYSATVASMREFAILRALGIPRWRMALAVMQQSFLIGIGGCALSVPVILLLSRVAMLVNAKVLIEWWMWTSVMVVTLTMAVLSGVVALRSISKIEPAALLR